MYGVCSVISGSYINAYKSRNRYAYFAHCIEKLFQRIFIIKFMGECKDRLKGNVGRSTETITYTYLREKAFSTLVYTKTNTEKDQKQKLI